METTKGAGGAQPAATSPKVAATKESDQARIPCVIYMHGNSSCRLEALDVLTVVLSSGTILTLSSSSFSLSFFMLLFWTDFGQDILSLIKENKR